MSEANVSIKQRLVGAIVLVSLGVIFLPMLLNGEGPFESVKREKFIPPEPDVKNVFDLASADKDSTPGSSPQQSAAEPVTPSATIVDSVSQNASRHVKKQRLAKAADDNLDVSPKPAVKTKSAAVVNKPPEKKPVSQARKVIENLKKKNTKTVKAWAVQLGSFKTRPNALRLRDKLRDKGFPSYVEAVKTKKGESYRVRVGPELLLTNAENLKIKLSKVAKLDGIIVNH